MSDVLQCHSKACLNSANTIKLSLDGVSECRSTSTSLDVYSVKMHECHNIYPLRIIRPLTKHYVDNQSQLKKVLNDINMNDSILTHVIADNPKRSFLRNSQCHGARYSCEYCFTQGQCLRDTCLLYTSPSPRD